MLLEKSIEGTSKVGVGVEAEVEVSELCGSRSWRVEVGLKSEAVSRVSLTLHLGELLTQLAENPRQNC